MEARDSNDMTPFMLSIISKHKDVIKLFIECGCEVYSQGKHGKTILDWAIENESIDLLEVSILHSIAMITIHVAIFTGSHQVA